MTSRYLILLTLVATTMPAAEPGVRSDRELRNAAYAVALNADHTVAVTHLASGARRTFSGRFVILACDRDPNLTYAGSRPEAYTVPHWDRAGGGGRTPDVFQAATEAIEVIPADAAFSPGRIVWRYPSSVRFELSASVEVPAGATEPKLSFGLQVRRAGWYSAAYSGAPAMAAGAAENIYQSRIWQEKRFPRLAFLSTERMCSLPAALLTAGGVTAGVAADPHDGPFRIPSFTDSRFGFAIRNAQGHAQPQFFSPVLGNANPRVLLMDQGLGRRIGDARISASQPSRLDAGAQMASSLRLIVRHGDWYETFVHLARELYGFADVRENVGGSLNQTIENIIAYALNDALAGWNGELKGSDYATDVPGTVKNVSALHPLSVALVTDNEDIFRRRALPMAEYLMSREKYLFATDPAITRQSPSAYLRGPTAEISELAALYLMSQQRTFAFRHLAETFYGKPRPRNLRMISGANWQDALAMYRMNGRREHLDKAVEGALRYVADRVKTPQTDFADVKIEAGGQFWSDMAPKWVDLIELYEESRDKRFLEAARIAGTHYASFVNLYPGVPDMTVRVNPGGVVGRYALQTRLFEHPQKMLASEAHVPAWQVSWNGLLPEAATTYGSNAAVFLAPHAAYFLRLAHYTGDAFFRDLARSAVVGRYLNYPGYAINGEFTTVYARPDYPLRPLSDVTYNNVYYPHIWPQVALLIDYLFSDVLARTGGRVDLPARYAQGYAYLQSKVYGDRAGKWFGDENVIPWMPAQVIAVDNAQVNYLTALGPNRFYVVLLNESAQPVKSTVRINSALVPLQRDRTYRARQWSHDGAVRATTLPGSGVFAIDLEGRGLTAIAVDGVTVQTQFQHKVLRGEKRRLGPRSHVQADAPWGPIKASGLSFADDLTQVYVYAEATGKELQAMRVAIAGETNPRLREDRSYPFECSVPWPAGATEMTLQVSAVTAAGAEAGPVTVTLHRD